LWLVNITLHGLKKEQLRIKSLKKEVVKEYIHVDNPKCKHCIELEKNIFKA